MAESTQEVAVLETNLGKIVVGFFPDKAPKHVEAFKKLVTDGFYVGTKFHRVIPGFMIQGGDPNTKTNNRAIYGTGGPDYRLKAEFNDVKMAHLDLYVPRPKLPRSYVSEPTTLTSYY